MNDNRDIPWDRRPLTARDFALTVGLGVFGCALFSGLMFFLWSAQRSGTEAARSQQVTEPARAAEQEAVASRVQQGRSVFEDKCASCHTIGGGELVGPDLQGVTERRDREWLEAWIQDPVTMIDEGDPTATQLLEQYNGVQMPDLGLNDQQVNALIDYMAQASTGEALTADTQPEPAVEGNAGRGRALFTGTQRFENRGPSCRACHSVSGIGALGGGALGPDLTGVAERFGGAQGLNAWLAQPPTPTMETLWSQRPLTAQERADLVAFLQEASLQERLPRVLLRLLGLSLSGALALVVVGAITWRKRLRSVRGSMVERSIRQEENEELR
ncbi:MAG: c-type cytochrome [Anaerolineae bacterium]|nr:c-type cytochrome [Anaerolineae bacterium]